ncbi:hypothetical protein PGT21_022311 [Puccinia graminis f. sp. tritici]|uniref:Uncharacterized protein n=1 Tax=Puccinia graminis f. sp. tritici TaxID=56615 RepID=A0A5B0MCF1_PUCGR|nr:hypothetical protein PGT21_022637 [Puccinia graminis f. sp. tritici]KAA1076855.1 hypothetical protein PGT21_022311 [Puccinia graminis f. sp. tritici]
MDMNNQMYRPKNYYASSKLSMNDGSSSGSVPPHVSGMLSREQACEALLHPKEQQEGRTERLPPPNSSFNPRESFGQPNRTNMETWLSEMKVWELFFKENPLDNPPSRELQETTVRIVALMFNIRNTAFNHRPRPLL